MSGRARPPGGWSSPLTAERVAAGSLRLAEPRSTAAGVAWLETRPAEGGRTTIVRCRPGEPARDIVPAPFNVKGRAHEYGGGAWCPAGDAFFFVNDVDRNVWRAVEGTPPRRVTDVVDLHFADLLWDGGRGTLACVVEDHSAAEVVNRLVAIDPETGGVRPLWQGSDFVSTPRVSPDGKRLAWLAWDRPHMPWTETRLWVGDLDATGELTGARPVGPEGFSVFQPEWGPDGALYFVCDADDWWNLYRLDDGTVRRLTTLDAELAFPQWVFGMRSYAFRDCGTVVSAMFRDGLWSVLTLDLASGEVEVGASRWTHIESLSIGEQGLVLLAGAPDRALSVVLVDDSGGDRVLRSAVDLEFDPGLLSLPESLVFPVGDDERAFGLHYRPRRSDTPPPLLVLCHGGPTAAASSALDLRTQFWTSRGFAVLDVNYRGSTGYGRAYREKLYGRWGVADVEDAVAGAAWLAARDLADPERLLIRGSSAGGFSVLCALTFHDTFAAGASYYGVSEIASLFETTSKFEADYGRWLLGDDIARVSRERSPLYHAERLKRPVVFFQGLEDRVVPPEQARTMYEALRSRGVPVALRTFENEGHGFRRAETIRVCLETELTFYRRVLRIPSDEPAAALPIDNLPG